MVGPLRRLDDGSLNQMRAAPIILREYIFRLLAQGDASHGEAQDVVKDLGRYALSSRDAELAHVAHSLDLAEILDAVAGHDAWDPRFRANQIEAVANSIRKKRARKAADRIRREAQRKRKPEAPT